MFNHHVPIPEWYQLKNASVSLAVTYCLILVWPDIPIPFEKILSLEMHPVPLPFTAISTNAQQTEPVVEGQRRALYNDLSLTDVYEFAASSVLLSTDF